MDVTLIESCALSLKGPVRGENQDAVVLPRPPEGCAGEEGGLYAVADGMGGYANGDVASRLALDALWAAFYGHEGRPAPGSLRRGVEDANLVVLRAAERLGAGHMGTTLTAIFIQNDMLHLAHVGDSRAYLVRGKRATCLTHDHTTVADLVRAHVIAPERLRTHPQRSVLTRSVGLGMFLQTDLADLRLKVDDRLVLCSDGVWSMIEDEEFAGLADRAETPRALSQALIDLALERESDDNVTVISVFVRQLAAAGAEPRRGFFDTLRGWLGAR